MTEQEYQQILDRIKAIGGSHSVATEKEITDEISRMNPHISVYQLDKLIRESKQLIQIVSQEEKNLLLQSMCPEEYEKDKPDIALIDKFFCVLVQREMDPEVRTCWEESLDQHALYRIIMEKRSTTAAEQLAEELGISLEELYYLERDLIKAYYTCSDHVSKK